MEGKFWGKQFMYRKGLQQQQQKVKTFMKSSKITNLTIIYIIHKVFRKFIYHYDEFVQTLFHFVIKRVL